MPAPFANGFCGFAPHALCPPKFVMPPSLPIAIWPPIIPVGSPGNPSGPGGAGGGRPTTDGYLVMQILLHKTHHARRSRIRHVLMQSCKHQSFGALPTTETTEFFSGRDDETSVEVRPKKKQRTKFRKIPTCHPRHENVLQRIRRVSGHVAGDHSWTWNCNHTSSCST